MIVTTLMINGCGSNNLKLVNPKYKAIKPKLKQYKECEIEAKILNNRVYMSLDSYKCWRINSKRCRYNNRVLKIANEAMYKQIVGDKNASNN